MKLIKSGFESMLANLPQRSEQPVQLQHPLSLDLQSG